MDIKTLKGLIKVAAVDAAQKAVFNRNPEASARADGADEAYRNVLAIIDEMEAEQVKVAKAAADDAKAKADFWKRVEAIDAKLERDGAYRRIARDAYSR